MSTQDLRKEHACICPRCNSKFPFAELEIRVQSRCNICGEWLECEKVEEHMARCVRFRHHIAIDAKGTGELSRLYLFLHRIFATAYQHLPADTIPLGFDEFPEVIRKIAKLKYCNEYLYIYWRSEPNDQEMKQAEDEWVAFCLGNGEHRLISDDGSDWHKWFKDW